MNIVKKWPIHVLLVAVYPALALYAANRDLVLFVEIWRALLVSAAAFLILFLALRLLRTKPQRAGLVVTIWAVLFFSYGHVMVLLARAQIKGFALLRPDYVTLFWPVAFILFTWSAYRLIKNTAPITVIMNTVSAALVIMALVQVFTVEVNGFMRKEPVLFNPAEISEIHAGSAGPSAPALPDVYYIILDGYGRADLLQGIVGLDNRDFIQSLNERGFYVAAESTANYSNTVPSLASSLNFGYIDALASTMAKNSMDYRPLRKLIFDNRISQVMRQYGYSIVTFETGFNLSEIHTSDRFEVVAPGPNYFESLLITNSLALLWTNGPFADRYRERISGTFDRLADLSDIPGPKFVFAHVMAAHPPFVFGPNGEVKGRSSRVELDAGDITGRQKEIQGYRDQLTYINKRVLKMVDRILENSTVRPIIIIQGDHGSGIYMDWQSAERTCFSERKAIFNAYYFPGGKTGQLYPSITPVNSFRVMLNTYYGAHLPLLEDRNYFSLWESPYDISDITGQVGACPVGDNE